MINIAAPGLYMLLTGTTASVDANTTQIIDNSNQTLVLASKEEPTNEIDVNVEAYVREYFKDAPIMAEVARCESHFTQFTKSGQVLRGRAVAQDVGVMQINETYHLAAAKKLGIDIYSLEGNLAYGRILYERNGTRDWMASSGCWSKVAINR